MTKKDFIELTDYHYYKGRSREESIVALFFGWKETNEGRGFSHCVFARASNSNKKELTEVLYNLVTREEETPWYINCAVVQNDKQRFKVPVSGSGVRSLIKYEPVKA